MALMNLSCHRRNTVLSSPNDFKFAIAFVSHIVITNVENGLASGEIPGGGNLVLIALMSAMDASVRVHNSATETSSFLNATSAVPVSVIILSITITNETTAEGNALMF